jgi:hypothetical protein
MLNCFELRRSLVMRSYDHIFKISQFYPPVSILN